MTGCYLLKVVLSCLTMDLSRAVKVVKCQSTTATSSTHMLVELWLSNVESHALITLKCCPVSTLAVSMARYDVGLFVS